MASYPQETGEPTTERAKPTSRSKSKPTSKTAAYGSAEKKSQTDHFDADKWQHLLSQLARHGWKVEGHGAVTWGFVMSMRQRYGSRVVDSALSDATLHPEAPVFSSAAYFQSICERYKALLA